MKTEKTEKNPQKIDLQFLHEFIWATELVESTTLSDDWAQKEKQSRMERWGYTKHLKKTHKKIIASTIKQKKEECERIEHDLNRYHHFNNETKAFLYTEIEKRKSEIAGIKERSENPHYSLLEAPMFKEAVDHVWQEIRQKIKRIMEEEPRAITELEKMKFLNSDLNYELYELEKEMSEYDSKTPEFQHLWKKYQEVNQKSLEIEDEIEEREEKSENQLR